MKSSELKVTAVFNYQQSSSGHDDGAGELIETGKLKAGMQSCQVGFFM